MDDRVKQGVRQAIALAVKTGRITYAELNELLPTAVVNIGGNRRGPQPAFGAGGGFTSSRHEGQAAAQSGRVQP